MCTWQRVSSSMTDLHGQHGTARTGRMHNYLAAFCARGEEEADGTITTTLAPKSTLLTLLVIKLQ